MQIVGGAWSASDGGLASIPLSRGRILVEVLSSRPRSEGLFHYGFSIEGRRFSAEGKVLLIPGRQYEVWIRGTGKGPLRLLSPRLIPARAEIPRVDPLTGISREARALARAFIDLRYAVPLPFLEELASKIPKFRNARIPPSLARFVATLFDKGLSLPQTSFEQLVVDLMGDSLSDRKEKNSRERRAKAEEIEQVIRKRSEEKDLWYLYNHTQGKSDHWIFLPFVWEDVEIKLHLLLTKKADKMRRMILSLRRGKIRWEFLLDNDASPPKLRGLCDSLQVLRRTSRTASKRLTHVLEEKGILFSGIEMWQEELPSLKAIDEKV